MIKWNQKVLLKGQKKQGKILLLDYGKTSKFNSICLRCYQTPQLQSLQAALVLFEYLETQNCKSRNLHNALSKSTPTAGTLVGQVFDCFEKFLVFWTLWFIGKHIFDKFQILPSSFFLYWLFARAMKTKQFC